MKLCKLFCVSFMFVFFMCTVHAAQGAAASAAQEQAMQEEKSKEQKLDSVEALLTEIEYGKNSKMRAKNLKELELLFKEGIGIPEAEETLGDMKGEKDNEEGAKALETLIKKYSPEKQIVTEKDKLEIVLKVIELGSSEQREKCLSQLELLFKKGIGFDEAQKTLVEMEKKEFEGADKLEALLNKYSQKQPIVSQEVQKKEAPEVQEKTVDNEQSEWTKKIDNACNGIEDAYAEKLKYEKKVIALDPKKSSGKKGKEALKKQTGKDRQAEYKKALDDLDKYRQLFNKYWDEIINFVDSKKTITAKSPEWVMELVNKIIGFVTEKSKIPDPVMQHQVLPCAMKLAQIYLWNDGWTAKIIGGSVNAAKSKHSGLRVKAFEFLKVLVEADEVEESDRGKIIDLLPVSLLDEYDQVRSVSLGIVKALLDNNQSVDKLQDILKKVKQDKRLKTDKRLGADIEKLDVLLKKHSPEILVVKNGEQKKNEQEVKQKNEPQKSSEEEKIIEKKPVYPVYVGGAGLFSNRIKINKEEDFKEAFEKAKKMLGDEDDEQRSEALSILYGLVKNGQDIKEALEIAKKMIPAKEKHVNMDVVLLFRYLVEKGQAFTEAIEVAENAIPVIDDEPKLSGPVFELFEELFKKGQGFEEARKLQARMKKELLGDSVRLGNLLEKYTGKAE